MSCKQIYSPIHLASQVLSYHSQLDITYIIWFYCVVSASALHLPQTADRCGGTGWLRDLAWAFAGKDCEGKWTYWKPVKVLRGFCILLFENFWMLRSLHKRTLASTRLDSVWWCLFHVESVEDLECLVCAKMPEALLLSKAGHSSQAGQPSSGRIDTYYIIL